MQNITRWKMNNPKIAKDRSMRTYDKNGHLIVERTVITKAGVNPYRGDEIVDYEKLGLDPTRVYYLLRDPDELKKGLDTFKLVQLMIKHIAVDADEPEKESTVGSIGSDIEMDGDNVTASLRVTDGKAIRLIESGKLSELSAGYYYDADMTQGEYNGEHYDGIMRNIHGNHVALVYRGRIGSDAIIKDEMPTNLWGTKMALKKGAYSRIAQKMKKSLGMDEDIELTPAQVEALTEAVQDEIAEDEDDPKADPKDKPAEDEDEDDDNPDTAKDEDDEPKSEKKTAMDAETIRASVLADAKASYEALEIVRPHVGSLAFDSAENIYKKAMAQMGIGYKGNDIEAMQMLIQGHKKPTMAKDSDTVSLPDNIAKLTERFK